MSDLMVGERLLWLMAEKPTFELNVREAITRYRMKTGQMPTLVTANSAEVPADGCLVDGIRVMGDKETLSGHLQVGMARNG